MSSLSFTPLPPRRLHAAIAAVLMTILLAALDQTIVSVALPTIAGELGGVAWMAWVVSGYLIASTIATPLYGRFSDLLGRRSVISAAIGVFLVASVACALAQTLPQLVLARVLQGIGGGGLISMAQALIADIVPMRERGRYQSYISIVWAVASVAGPLAGGLLTQYLSWPWIFWVNLPVGLVALLLVRGALDAQAPAATRSRIDVLGIVLLVLGLVALLVPITRVGQGVAIGEAGNLAGFACAAAALYAFWRQERRAADPILPIGLLREKAIVVCCTMLFVCFFIFIALSLLVPLRLQWVLGMAPGEAATRLLPLTLGIPAAAFASGRFTYRTGKVRPPQILGVLLVPLSLATMAALPAERLAAGAVAMTALGFGFGCQLPTTLLTVQNAIPRAWLGTATALTAFFRLLGGAVGTAVLSALVLAWLHVPGAVEGMPAAAGRADDAAFRAMLWVGAALSLVGVAAARHLPDTRLDLDAGASAGGGEREAHR